MPQTLEASPLAADNGAPAGSHVDVSPRWQRGGFDPDRGYVGRWRRELLRRKAAMRDLAVDDPRRGPPVLGVVRALAGELPREEISSFLDQVGPVEQLDPHVAAVVRRERAALAETRGDGRSAGELYAELGHVMDWLVVGPFEYAGRGAEPMVHGPLRDSFSRDQSFIGKLPTETLVWRELGPAAFGPGARVDLSDFMYPRSAAVAYLTSWVYLPKPQAAALRLGSSGAYRVWLDGELVGQGDARRPSHPLQDAYRVQLQSGWQRVLVEVAVDDGPWGLHLWFSGADGKALRGLYSSSAPERTRLGSEFAESLARSFVNPTNEGSKSPAKPAKPRKKRRRSSKSSAPSSLSLRQALERRVVGRTPNLRDMSALLELYRRTRPFDRDDSRIVDLARNIDERQPTARSALDWAMVESVDNERRRLLDLAHARAGGHEGEIEAGLRGTIAFERAMRDQMARLNHRARQGVAEAVATSPDDPLIELAAIALLDQDGLSLAALDWSADLLRRFPQSRTLLREHAGRLADLGRLPEAMATLERLSQMHPADGLALRQRSEMLLAHGRVDEALALSQQYARSVAHSPAAHRSLALTLQAAGRQAEALRAHARALELSPHDPRLHRERGHYAVRAGEPREALRSFRRSLELNPRQPQLEDLVAKLSDHKDNDLFARLGLDLRAVVEAAPAASPGRDVELLHQRVALRVDASGLGERLEHRVFRINSERGAREFGPRYFAFDPDQSRVEVRRAQLLHVDGRIERNAVERVRSLAASGHRMYYDQRLVGVAFPNLVAGDVVEVAFLRRDIASRSLFDEHFSDFSPLQGEYPVLASDYTLEVPVGLDVNANVDFKRSRSADGRRSIYQLSWPALPRIEAEPSMPGGGELADHVQVSDFATWNEVAHWYWGLVRGQLRVDDAIRAGVAEALAPLPPEASIRDKIAAVHAHVVQKTRYVGLEFGIHGYKPYPTTEVYDRRFGDCKDKASLLKVMLAEIGIPSHLVLIRTRDRGHIAQPTPSLAIFNHAIVYLPGQDIYLDGTAEFSGLMDLPEGDRGANALIVRDADGGSFRTTPEAKPEWNMDRREVHLEISRRGSVRGQITGEVKGAGAGQWRRHFEAEEQRQEGLRAYLANTYPRVELRTVQFSDTENLLQPVSWSAELAVPELARRSGNQLHLPVLARDSTLLADIAAPSQRRHPLVWRSPSESVEVFHYTLAKGLRWEKVPPGAELTTKFGRLSLKVEVEGRKARVELRLTRHRRQIAAGDYQAFRDFLRDVDGAVRQELVIGGARP